MLNMIAILLLLLYLTRSAPFFLTTITLPRLLQNCPLSLEMLTPSLIQVEILMGHLTHRMPQVLYPQGIQMHIRSSSPLSQSQVSQLASAFGVSEKKSFRLMNPEQTEITIADPNDRLCNQHIQNLLRLFLPCKNWVQLGLQHLLAIDTLTHNFLTLNITWRPSAVVFTILQERGKGQLIQQTRKGGQCGQIEVKLLKQKQQFIHPIGVQRISLSKWYSPEKTISLVLSPSSSLSNHTSCSVLTRLPAGFRFIQVLPMKGSPSFTFQIEIKSDLSHLITVHFALPLLQQTVVQIRAKAGLPIFEKFQSIGGGGEELLGVTRYEGRGKRLEVGLTSVSQQLLQPDFSINFHTITACSLVFLILWLSLWRNHRTFPQVSVLEDEE